MHQPISMCVGYSRQSLPNYDLDLLLRVGLVLLGSLVHLSEQTKLTQFLYNVDSLTSSDQLKDSNDVRMVVEFP